MPNSVTEVGCIHTIQGLEADYIGVIVGDDLVYRDGLVKVCPPKRSKDDYTKNSNIASDKHQKTLCYHRIFSVSQ